MLDATKSKELLESLLFIGASVPVEHRIRLRIACRRFKNPANMALGLLLDAIRHIDSSDKKQN